MKFNITHQRLFAALTSLLLITIAGAVALTWAQFTNIEQIPSSSLVASFFESQRGRFPTLQIILTLALCTSAIYTTGRTVATYKLFTTSYYIQMPLMALIVWSVALSSSYVLASLIIYISSLLLSNLLRIVRSGTTAGEVLNTALLASTLVLLYPPAIVMWAVIPIALFIAQIPLREWLVALVGLILPPFATMYIAWLAGGEFLYIARYFWELLISESGLLTINEVPLFEISIISIVVFLALIGVLIILFSESTHRTKIRLFLISLLSLACLATTLLPSASIHTLSLAAPSLALLSTLALIRLPRWFSNFSYLLLVLLFLLDIAIDLYLPL